MSRTFFPKAHYMPHMIGAGYVPLYRWYEESPWTVVPGSTPHPTVGQALKAAEAYMKERLNPTIRAEKAEAEPIDSLGVEEWRAQKQAAAAIDQQAVFGARIIKGKVIKVERRKIA